MKIYRVEFPYLLSKMRKAVRTRKTLKANLQLGLQNEQQQKEIEDRKKLASSSATDLEKKKKGRETKIIIFTLSRETQPKTRNRDPTTVFWWKERKISDLQTQNSKCSSQLQFEDKENYWDQNKLQIISLEKTLNTYNNILLGHKIMNKQANEKTIKDQESMTFPKKAGMKNCRVTILTRAWSSWSWVNDPNSRFDFDSSVQYYSCDIWFYWTSNWYFGQ